MTPSRRILAGVLGLAAVLAAVPAPSTAQGPAGLDAFWAEVSRTVAAGDFAGYAALYHPDAVLVSRGGGTTSPISRALEGWQTGFERTRRGTMKASVEFRITCRISDATTAHEKGLFRYVSQVGDGSESVSLVHFEALLVRKSGRWLMTMELQGDDATAAEWEAAAAPSDPPSPPPSTPDDSC